MVISHLGGTLNAEFEVAVTLTSSGLFSSGGEGVEVGVWGGGGEGVESLVLCVSPLDDFRGRPRLIGSAFLCMSPTGHLGMGRHLFLDVPVADPAWGGALDARPSS